ncbi:hypothetical protein LCGC14_0236490 [marine sediment metagenome]|uniref:Uncharacterized protein n=1 Tax=marine sediment metagenome TaxID=412755 RepID=A0A0F9WU17_9ZZZZ
MRKRVDMAAAEPWVAVEEVKRLNTRRKVWFWISEGVVGLGLCLLFIAMLIGTGDKFAVWIMVGGCSLVPGFLYVNWVYEKTRSVWLTRVFEAPFIMHRNAQRLYGKSWEEDVVECYEAHGPGDCLLCGAE